MIVAAKILIAYLIIQGALLCLIAAVGTLRLPDVYTRMHASSKGATLGVASVLLGVFFYYWFINGVFSGKVLLGIVFIFLTVPVGSHLLGRAAYSVGVKLDKRSVQDDYKGHRNFVIKHKDDSYL
ncbi:MULTISPECIES: monovalent cation/H(+) antiporter subunit G [Bacillus]|uniref:Cation:proton antiporter n=2 Tax=Bacillus TaxID=1386 RepID=A0A0M4FUT0_9BACI|nr:MULTISPECIES: monovalent cation/H(+) antiporter subunit G [Bacillus]ALC82205.1 cation:proton antiporter [Bacillus gobiensis]MBP1081043.1 multicomponent Na+:H+ antiporter subunit G [Bacillus capparidis]MED1095735.1 monovalent cation/H(+) antiporter subunit G [Bacillus capparidis]